MESVETPVEEQHSWRSTCNKSKLFSRFTSAKSYLFWLCWAGACQSLFCLLISSNLFSIQLNFSLNEVKFDLCSFECKFKIKRTKPNFHRIFPKLVAQIYNVLNCTFQFDYPAITFHLILKL